MKQQPYAPESLHLNESNPTSLCSEFRICATARHCKSALKSSRESGLCLSYLHNRIEGGVCPNTQIGAGYIVTDGGRHHTHGYAKLLVGSTSLKQLQQTLKCLKRHSSTWKCVRATKGRSLTERGQISLWWRVDLPFRLLPRDSGWWLFLWQKGWAERGGDTEERGWKGKTEGLSLCC